MDDDHFRWLVGVHGLWLSDDDARRRGIDIGRDDLPVERRRGIDVARDDLPVERRRCEHDARGRRRHGRRLVGADHPGIFLVGVVLGGAAGREGQDGQGDEQCRA